MPIEGRSPFGGQNPTPLPPLPPPQTTPALEGREEHLRVARHPWLLRRAQLVTNTTYLHDGHPQCAHARGGVLVHPDGRVHDEEGLAKVKAKKAGFHQRLKDPQNSAHISTQTLIPETCRQRSAWHHTEITVHGGAPKPYPLRYADNEAHGRDQNRPSIEILPTGGIWPHRTHTRKQCAHGASKPYPPT